MTGIPKTLRTLLVASNRLTSLTSFQHLVNIERLDLSDNQLDSVHQLACLRHLRELKLDGNQVDSLDGLAGLDSLVKLSLKGNALVKVDLARTSWRVSLPLMPEADPSLTLRHIIGPASRRSTSHATSSSRSRVSSASSR